MAKEKQIYFTIEKYSYLEDVDRFYSQRVTRYDVKKFNSKKELEKGLLKGPEYGGKLIVAKQIPIKLELRVE